MNHTYEWCSYIRQVFCFQQTAKPDNSDVKYTSTADVSQKLRWQEPIIFYIQTDVNNLSDKSNIADGGETPESHQMLY